MLQIHKEVFVFLLIKALQSSSINRISKIEIAESN